jgi:hypothetical protein
MRDGQDAEDAGLIRCDAHHDAMISQGGVIVAGGRRSPTRMARIARIGPERLLVERIRACP